MTAIQAFGAIISALISAGIGALMTYRLVVKRKRVSFWIGRTEDLTWLLRRAHAVVAFRIGGAEVENLNTATVTARNTGNVAITSLEFEIEIPERHAFRLAETKADNAKLRQAVQINDVSLTGNDVRPKFKVLVPFFNPKELFEVQLLFDGTKDECVLRCRMEDVKIEIRGGRYVDITKDLSYVLFQRAEGWLFLTMASGLVLGLVRLLSWVFGLDELFGW